MTRRITLALLLYAFAQLLWNTWELRRLVR